LLCAGVAAQAVSPSSDNFAPCRARAEQLGLGEARIVALDEHDGFPLQHGAAAADALPESRNARYGGWAELVFLFDALAELNSLELGEWVGQAGELRGGGRARCRRQRHSRGALEARLGRAGRRRRRRHGGGLGDDLGDGLGGLGGVGGLSETNVARIFPAFPAFPATFGVGGSAGCPIVQATERYARGLTVAGDIRRGEARPSWAAAGDEHLPSFARGPDGGDRGGRHVRKERHRRGVR
jgi:hypothetical protein